MKKLPMDMMRKEYYTTLTEKMVGSTNNSGTKASCPNSTQRNA